MTLGSVKLTIKANWNIQCVLGLEVLHLATLMVCVHFKEEKSLHAPEIKRFQKVIAILS